MEHKSMYFFFAKLRFNLEFDRNCAFIAKLLTQQNANALFTARSNNSNLQTEIIGSRLFSFFLLNVTLPSGGFREPPVYPAARWKSCAVQQMKWTPRSILAASEAPCAPVEQTVGCLCSVTGFSALLCSRQNTHRPTHPRWPLRFPLREIDGVFKCFCRVKWHQADDCMPLA